MMFVGDRELFEGVKLVRHTAIASLAFWAIWGAGEEIVATGFMLLLAGFPVYAWLKWRQGQEPLVEREVPLQRPPLPRKPLVTRTPTGVR